MSDFRKLLLAMAAVVLMVGLLSSPASAAMIECHTGDGCSYWGGDVQTPITDIDSPPWAPNGTTAPGAVWVNRVDSGFQGGGPALGFLTTYTLTVADVVSFRIRALADDGSHIRVSVDGGAFVTLVNSSGAPQGTNCSSLQPSCTSSMVWDSGVILVNGGNGGDVLVENITSQDYPNSPMAIQMSFWGNTSDQEQVPEPSTVFLLIAGLSLFVVGKVAAKS